MPQLARLREIRKPDQLDDTVDPTTIESSASTLDDFMDGVLAQLKAITGETNWFDTPAATLASDRGLSQYAPGPIESSYMEVTAPGPFPNDVTWWESAAKLVKKADLLVTRDASQNPTTVRWQLYNAAGDTVIATVTDTIVYSGPFQSTRTRVFS